MQMKNALLIGVPQPKANKLTTQSIDLSLQLGIILPVDLFIVMAVFHKVNQFITFS